MKKLIEKIKSKFCRKPLLVIPAVSGSTPHPEGSHNIGIGFWETKSILNYMTLL